MQGALRPLAVLPALESRLSALESTLSGASRGMGVAAGALAREAAAASDAAARVEAALSSREWRTETLETLLERRDAQLQEALVSELLPPLRAVSMQMLSVAAAAGGAAASAAAAGQPGAPLLLELPDAQLQQLCAAMRAPAEAGEGAEKGVRLDPEQWSALGGRLQRLEQQLWLLSEQSGAEAEEGGPGGREEAYERMQALLAEANRERTLQPPAVPASPPPQARDRSIPDWLEEERETQLAFAASGGEAQKVVAAAAVVPQPQAPEVGAGAAAPPSTSPPDVGAASDPAASLRAGLEALRAGRAAAATGGPADDFFASAHELFSRAAAIADAEGGGKASASAHGNCGNALLERARLVLGQAAPGGEKGAPAADDTSRAEEWLVLAGRSFRSALQASPGEGRGRALQQWGTALALRGRMLAADTPTDGAQLFAAAAEKFSAAAALPQPHPGAHASLGAVLAERAACLGRGSPGRRAALEEAVRALEEAVRREPGDGAVASLLRRLDSKLLEEDMER